MIEIESITKSIGGRRVLDSLSFTIAKGEFLSLFGPNGCGKSTLINILCGVEQADSGNLHGLEPIRRNIGCVFQDYRKSLLPWLNAKENIVFPLRLRGVANSQISRMLDEITSSVNVTFGMNQRVYSLSGGQAQTVALLRALITRPQFLILDEPFSALDFEASMVLRETLMRVTSKIKLTTLLVSHDLEEALFFGDRILFLSPSPARIIREMRLPWSRPRAAEIVGSTQFAVRKLEAVQIALGRELPRTA